MFIGVDGPPFVKKRSSIHLRSQLIDLSGGNFWRMDDSATAQADCTSSAAQSSEVLVAEDDRLQTLQNFYA